MLLLCVCVGVGVCAGVTDMQQREMRSDGAQAAACGGRPRRQCNARLCAAHVSPACAEGGRGQSARACSTCAFHTGGYLVNS